MVLVYGKSEIRFNLANKWSAKNRAFLGLMPPNSPQFVETLQQLFQQQNMQQQQQMQSQQQQQQQQQQVLD